MKIEARPLYLGPSQVRIYAEYPHRNFHKAKPFESAAICLGKAAYSLCNLPTAAAKLVDWYGRSPTCGPSLST